MEKNYRKISAEELKGSEQHSPPEIPAPYKEEVYSRNGNGETDSTGKKI
jgi:hypothetical protein